MVCPNAGGKAIISALISLCYLVTRGFSLFPSVFCCMQFALGCITVFLTLDFCLWWSRGDKASLLKAAVSSVSYKGDFEIESMNHLCDENIRTCGQMTQSVFISFKLEPNAELSGSQTNKRRRLYKHGEYHRDDLTIWPGREWRAHTMWRTGGDGDCIQVKEEPDSYVLTDQRCWFQVICTSWKTATFFSSFIVCVVMFLASLNRCLFWPRLLLMHSGKGSSASVTRENGRRKMNKRCGLRHRGPDLSHFPPKNKTIKVASSVLEGILFEINMSLFLAVSLFF